MSENEIATLLVFLMSAFFMIVMGIVAFMWLRDRYRLAHPSEFKLKGEENV